MKYIFVLIGILLLISSASATVVGRTWNQTNPSPTLSGCFDVNYTATTCPNFNTTNPWQSMGRLTINGQIMTQVMQFWYRVDNVTPSVGIHWVNYSISDTNITGFNLHPAFNINGTFIPYFYIGSFDGAVTNTTPGYNNSGYNSGDFAGVNFAVGAGDKLSSVPGVKPLSGKNATASLINDRILAHNRGPNWELQSSPEVFAVELLYTVEYGSFYSQSVLSPGITAITDDSATNMALPTGLTAGNLSNSESGTNATDCGNYSCSLTTVHYQTHQVTNPFSYRGIEDLYGNVFTWVDGININNSVPWIANYGFASSTYSTPYVSTGLTLLASNTYVTNIVYSPGFDYGFLPSTGGGSSSTYLTDYYYQSTGDKAAEVGGSWSNGATAGDFLWELDLTPSSTGRIYGARVSYISPVYAGFTPSVSNNVVAFADNSYNISTLTGVSGKPLSWNYAFGDGSVSTSQSPSHTYTAIGAFTVNQTVTDASGATSTSLQQVTITTIPPVASFTANTTSGVAPLAVQFNDTSLNSPTSWYWVFGDGSTSIVENATHTFGVGNWSVNLTASNTAGSNTSTQTTWVNVSLITPTASFTATPTSGSTPLSVQFTDTSGYAPSSWSWNFGDGDSTNNTQQNPLHIYLISGIYNVSLTATNSAGSNTSIQLNYIVVSAVPVANFTGYPTFGYAPFVVNFTDTSYGLPTSWSWDFGDWIYTSSVQNPTHIYNNPGKYSVSLTVSNAYGTNTTKIRRYIIVTTSPSFKNDYTWVFTLMTLIETLPIFIGIGLLLYYLKMPKREPVVLLGGLTSFLSGIVILIVMVITIPYLGSIIGGLI